MNFKFVLACFFSVCLSFSTKSQLDLPALFSDNLVLQQQTEVPIWGWSSEVEAIIIETSWDQQKYTAKVNQDDEWRARIKTPEAGGPFTITIKQGETTELIENILIGEVWLCSGQSNMEMPLKGFPGQPIEGGNESIIRSKNDQIRLITIPRDSKVKPKNDFEGSWEEAKPSSTSNFSATAWYFGNLLYAVLDVPVGLIHVSYGGSSIEAWMSKEMLEDFDEITIPKIQEDIGEPNRTATALFNGMLYPTIGYGIRGAIWYQGESNRDRPFQYQLLLEDMVSEWREIWDQGEFPFYFAQIAPFNYNGAFDKGKMVPEKFNSAFLREAQLKASHNIPNSGMAVLMDSQDPYNIHPAKKRIAGERLAYQALAKTYGVEGFEFQSPEFEALEIKSDTVIVAFQHAPNGITSYGKEVKGFEIAGADKKFYPAKAAVRSKSVVLTSEVKEPVAVRYLFHDISEAELFSVGGLPISSFRTDNW